MLKHLNFWGLESKSASIEAREYFARLNVKNCTERLLSCPDIQEVLILSTCNRFEIYLVSESPAAAEIHMNSIFSTHNLQYGSGQSVIQHLYQVTSGLKSAVLGEQHITSQVKESLTSAQTFKSVGPVLNTLFQSALKTSKSIREFWQRKGGMMSYEARLWSQLNIQSHQKVLILGIGNLGSSLAKFLIKKPDVELYICNRNNFKAQSLANKLKCEYIPWEDRLSRYFDMNILFSAVSIQDRQDVILTPIEQENLLMTKTRTIVDLSMPRSLPAQPEYEFAGRHFNLDDLFKSTCLYDHPLVTAANSIIQESIIEYMFLWEKRMAIKFAA